MGSIAAAATDFQEFIRREPNSPEGEYLLGLLDLTASRTPAAIQHLQRAVQIDPKLADAYYYLAEALYSSKRTAEARSALSECLQIDPTSPKALALRPKLGQN